MIYIFYYQRHIAILTSSPYIRLRLKKEISARPINSPYTATTSWPHNIKHIDTDLIYPPKDQKLLFFGCGHFLSFCDLGAFFEFPYMVSGHTPPPATSFPDQTEHSEHIICQIENKRPLPIVKKFAIGSMEQFTYTPLLLYSQNWRLRFAQKIISSWETLAFRTMKKTPRGILLTVKIDKICQTELHLCLIRSITT